MRIFFLVEIDFRSSEINIQRRLCILFLYIVINYFYIIIYFRSLSYDRLKNGLLIGKGNEQVWQQY